VIARASGLLALALGVWLAGCERSSCEDACKRVANCTLAGTQGERMLGEGKLPADPACMRRCEDKHDDFMKCEGAKRECAELLSCPRW
jgi:Cys-rich protein (TIGR04453 family)